MNFIRLLLILIFCCNPVIAAQQVDPQLHIGLLIMATGKYTCFLEKLVASADAYFLPNHKKTYFIFTDGKIPNNEKIVRIPQERLGWPYDTMMRFAVYASHQNLLCDMDYLFACDADMLFVAPVGDEVLGQSVATRHPGFVMPHQRHDDYERDTASTACVCEGEGQYYFAGGFYGGTTQEFLRIAATCSARILQDLSQGIIAKYHDESHLNRYFIDYPPTVVLSPSYCFVEFWDLPFEPRLVAIHKNHAEFQTHL